MRNISRRTVAVGATTAAVAGALVAGATTSNAASSSINFSMVRSTGVVAAGCLANASANVKVTSRGPVEVMTVDAKGLPKNSEFDLFVLQVPDAPFGVSWYQGDMESDATGKAHGQFIGRFNIETFAVAPGTAPAPRVHTGGAFPDAGSNPAFAPVHTFHLGLWFGSPAVAAAAGCPTTATPFNGDHNAGIQALSTRNAPANSGPLRRLRP